MANRIGPMDQGILGKIGEKVGDTGTTGRVSAGKSATDANVAKTTNTGETVELTSGGKLLERLEKTLAEIPAIDSARVADVRSAIENGEYHIDADKIAESMLRIDREIGE